MSSVNKHHVIGRLGQDPEVRTTQSNNKVANFSVATSVKFTDKKGNEREETTWHRVVAWNGLAEIVEKYLEKGSRVYVEGPNLQRKYKDKEGIERTSYEIRANDLTMLGSGSSNN